MTWVGPVGGGPNNGNPQQQSVSLTSSAATGSTAAGQTFSGLAFSNGNFTIAHNNVTVQNCTTTPGGPAGTGITVNNGVTGAVVEDCYIAGTGTAGVNTAGILENRTPGANFYRRNNILGSRNSFVISSPSTISDNWCHGHADINSDGNPPHFQVIEMDGGVNGTTIRHNSLIMDTTSGGAVAVIQLNDTGGAFTNITVDNNLLISVNSGALIFEVTNVFTGASCSWSCTNNKTILAGEACCSAGTASGTTLTVAGSLFPGPFPQPVVPNGPFQTGQGLWASGIGPFLTIGSLGTGSGGLGTYNIAGGTASLTARTIIAYNAYWWYENSPVSPSPFTGNVDFYSGTAIPGP